MPMLGFSGAPLSAGMRYTRSPPDGSHSATIARRGHTPARATAVVVTPGEPLSEARTIRDMRSAVRLDEHEIGGVRDVHHLGGLHGDGGRQRVRVVAVDERDRTLLHPAAGRALPVGPGGHGV